MVYLNISLRPIATNKQVPTYKISKYFSNILNNVVGKTNSHIKGSWKFQNFITNTTISNNYKILCLDLESLFTNTYTHRYLN